METRSMKRQRQAILEKKNKINDNDNVISVQSSRNSKYSRKMLNKISHDAHTTGLKEENQSKFETRRMKRKRQELMENVSECNDNDSKKGTQLLRNTKRTEVKTGENLSSKFIVNDNPPKKLFTEPVVRLNRLNITQIQRIMKNIANANKNENDNDNDNVKELECTTSNGMQTRSMKRKHVDIDNLKNDISGKSKVIEKPKARRIKKLTIREEIEMNAPNNEFVANEIVLCTIPGFCPWPARIIQIVNETLTVEFFGTGQKNLVRATAIARFELNRTIPLLGRKGYSKAMQEVEKVLGIPLNVSLFK